jgi:hypothetical protein
MKVQNATVAHGLGSKLGRSWESVWHPRLATPIPIMKR